MPLKKELEPGAGEEAGGETESSGYLLTLSLDPTT